MLRKFAAALVATALVAGPAIAAQPSSGAGTTPATAAAPAAVKEQTPAKQTDTRKPVKMVKHVRGHVRHHFAHVAKPGKTVKNSKSSS